MVYIKVIIQSETWSNFIVPFRYLHVKIDSDTQLGLLSYFYERIGKSTWNCKKVKQMYWPFFTNTCQAFAIIVCCYQIYLAFKIIKRKWTFAEFSLVPKNRNAVNLILNADISERRKQTNTNTRKELRKPSFNPMSRLDM